MLVALEFGKFLPNFYDARILLSGDYTFFLAEVRVGAETRVLRLGCVRDGRSKSSPLDTLRCCFCCGIAY